VHLIPYAEVNARCVDLFRFDTIKTAFSVAKLAHAVEEPKTWTPEAKKKYANNAPVCVTMPTAFICGK
jgi:hypothetical protein